MKNGFLKVAAGTVPITVADIRANTAAILERINEADQAGVNLLVLPELCVTGYTCGDLFFSTLLLSAAEQAVGEIAQVTKGKYPLCVIGVPYQYHARLYNCAVVLHDGHILALIPKTYLPNYGEFYEKRQFSSAKELGGCTVQTVLAGQTVPFGTDIILQHATMKHFTFAVEICEDLWAPAPPSEKHCLAGAMIIANPTASNEMIGKDEYRRSLVSSTSARLVCGYIYANAESGESTQDMVFSQHHILCENGATLAENKPFASNTLTMTEFDVDRLASERHRITSYENRQDGYTFLTFDQPLRETPLTRVFQPNPFVPRDEDQLNHRASSILQIQVHGLAKRIRHTHSATAVVGISGGLDSCLALLVMTQAMDLLGRNRKDILAVTMPCFGTTKRTRSNAQILCESLGVTFREVDITAAVNQHFADIGQDPQKTDVTFENCQARERTQVLMDIANKENGLVVGTGDLSELALGWATYNGDHMSMYGVNTSVPKTLVRYIVRYAAYQADETLKTVLLDILDTPVSPELLPVNEKGEMVQMTEDLVGPYELHDFFLYYTLRFGFAPDKTFRLACRAYEGAYDRETIKQWLKIFLRRFFTQQFKRSCMPDGPKVGSVTLSPRGDWRMPSDASYALWLEEVEKL